MTITQAPCRKEDGETNRIPEEDNTAGGSLSSGDDGSSSSGNLTSSSPLQTPRECQLMGTSERPYIRGGFGNRAQHRLRSEMVAKQLQPAQWETLADNTVGPNNRIRCVQEGLGSQLPRSKYWRPLVSSGKDPPHQLSRTPSCLSGSEVICLQADSNLDPSSSGQHYSNHLPEQNGRYPFTFTLETGCGNLELVHHKEFDYPCRAPSRNRGCASRLGVMT